MDDNVGAVMSGDQPDVLLLPDAVGAAQDIIDDIGIFGVKAGDMLARLALGR